MKKIISRIKEPTPKFFRKLRNIGLVFTAVSGVIATAPVSLPTLVVSIAGYLAVDSVAGLNLLAAIRSTIRLRLY
jgi:hypothetical protein